MNDITQKISPEWSLRIGFAAMYIYSGTDLIRNPHNWTWAVPGWFNGIISRILPIDTYLRFQGAGELIFALVFLAWFLSPKIVSWVALLGAAEMAGILFLGAGGIDATTFRDLGLLGGLIALHLISKRRG